jgi:4-amino-4-deoxy-L-arabinose transferase-like glycosyltransferase
VRRAVPSLVLIACFSFFLGLGRPAISDSDEGFYAEAAREMVEGGDWLTPHFNYAERWQKPVLYYWLTSATYLVAGPSEWAARFWSALSGLGLVLVTWAAARRMFAQDDVAWLAGAIVATCAGYFAMARFALPDLPLTFFITLTIWAGFERKWIVVGLAAGLGFLMKGPVALVVPGVVLAPIWWHERHTLPLRVRDLTLAAAVGALIGLPWYGAMTLEHGVPYLQSFFVGDNLERFATDRFNEPRGLWFYLPVVIGGIFPWSIYLVTLPWRSTVAVMRRQRRLTDVEWRLLAWASLPLLFFTISIGKQPRYILPVLPPLAILLACSITERIRKSERGMDSRLAGATWGTAAIYLVLAILLYRARPLFVAAYPSVTIAGIMLTTGSALVLAWLAATRTWRLLPPIATAFAVVVLFTLQFSAIAGIRPEPVEHMAALIRVNRSSEPVGTYQVFVRNLAFYTGSAQRDLFNEELVLDFLRSPQPVLLVVRATDLPRLESITGVTTRRLGQVRYLNAANIRLRTLLAPIPEQDVETVLLVSNR